MSINAARAQTVLVVLGMLSIAAFMAVRASEGAALAAGVVLSLLVLAAIALGLRWSVGRRARGWQLFAAGMVALSLGDLFAVSGGSSGARALISDAFYVAAYPLFAATLIRFARSREAPGAAASVHQLLDAGILFVTAFGALWVFAVGADASGSGLPPLDALLTALYPALDIMLLALIFGIAVSRRRSPQALRLLALGFAALFVADLAVRLVPDGERTITSLLTALFMGSYLLLGAAILDRSAPALESLSLDTQPVPTPAWIRLSGLALIALVPAGIVAFAEGRLDSQSDRLVLGLVIATLPLLILLRLGLLLLSLGRATADLNLIIDSSPVPMAVIRRGGSVQLWNKAAARVSGYSAADMLAQGKHLIPSGDADLLTPIFVGALAGDRQSEVDVALQRSDGQVMDLRVSAAPLSSGDGRLVALFEDVTEERRHQEELEFHARHDALTGLPNRRFFVEQLDARLADPAAGQLNVALLDIDNFKSLNETAGLATGDDILRELAAILDGTTRRGDVLARLSGDEFALLLSDARGRPQEPIVERALEAVRAYRRTSTTGTIDATISAGVYALDSADTPDVALRRADEALYQAKARGKNRVETWTPHATPTIHTARTWSPLLKDALTEGRIALYVQPIVSLPDGEIAYYEALARLVTPDGVVHPAGAWIEHAEELGLMPAIDGHMLDLAARFLAEHPRLRLLVNISASSFHDRRLLDRLEDALGSLRPRSLGIEVTEHTALRDAEDAAVTLGRLRALGAILAIDDFGLGFTSFRDLATIPSDLVKIPGHLGVDECDTPIVARAITAVARHYNRKVVLEGIETEADATEATTIGIDYGQGWYFGRPCPAADILVESLPPLDPAGA